MVEFHTIARKVGNSWAVLIPKEKADEIGLTADNPNLHVSLEKIAKLKEIAGLLKTKKTTAQIMKEIDEGWD
ncbi:hypothetical protein HY990_04190 [Candidatus Micrarchaeota archaeon]|nr:hypothetical protein [Candidatus Micrarchaeota archaeon]